MIHRSVLSGLVKKHDHSFENGPLKKLCKMPEELFFKTTVKITKSLSLEAIYICLLNKTFFVQRISFRVNPFSSMFA